MMYDITTSSDHVLKIMKNCARGTVHSIYRKTINLSMGEQLIALQAADSPLSPISLICSLSAQEMNRLPVAVGDTVTVNNHFMQLLIGTDCLFSFKHADIYDLNLFSSVSSQRIPALEQEIKSAVTCQDKGSFELLFSQFLPIDKIENNFFLAAALNYLKQTSHCLADSCWNEAAHSLCRLIGLGPGLTPGGDDFLCGVLAGLIFCDCTHHPFSIALHESIASHLDNTNTISAAFLQCALNKQFSMAVCSLCQIPSREKILHNFQAIGHSSGTDTLCGIVYLLQNRDKLLS